MRWRRVLMIASGVMLAVSIVGFIVTLILNVFVLDKYNAYGEVPVPGSAELWLPAGEVLVSFHTQVIGSPSGGGLPVPALGLTIQPPAGVPDPAVTESIGSTTTVNNDSRRRVWRVEIPVDGTYTVSTEGQVGGFISPRLAFGHAGPLGHLVWSFVALFVLALLCLGGALWSRLRSHRPATVAVSSEPNGLGVRVQELNHLAALRDCGALTEAEFEAEKRRILQGR